MSNELNIPLVSTRQLHWRVLQIGGKFLGVLVLGWIVFRAIAIGLPQHIAPKDSDVVLYIPKTITTARLARHHFASTSAVPGGPWSLKAMMEASHRGIILALSGDETTVIIDRADQSMLDIAEQFDLHGEIIGKTTIISTAQTPETLVSAIPRFLPGLLQPSTVAIMSTGNDVARVHYDGSHDRLVFASAHLFDAPTGGIGTPDSELLIAAKLPAESLISWDENRLPLMLPGLHALAELSRSAGISAYISLDERHRASFLLNWETTAAADMDSLAIGRDLIAIPSLTTKREDNEDDSTRYEIIAEEPTTTTRTEGEYTFADIANADERVRMTTGPSTLSITNDFSTDAPIAPPFSTRCASRSLALVRPASISNAAKHVAFLPSSLAQSLWLLSEVTQTAHEVRACWD